MFLATKHGVEAKNYDGVGEAAKLKPLEVELKRIEEEDDDDPPPRMTCAEKLWECWLSWRGLLFIGYGT